MEFRDQFLSLQKNQGIFYSAILVLLLKWLQLLILYILGYTTVYRTFYILGYTIPSSNCFVTS